MIYSSWTCLRFLENLEFTNLFGILRQFRVHEHIYISQTFYNSQMIRVIGQFGFLEQFRVLKHLEFSKNYISRLIRFLEKLEFSNY